MIRDIYELTSEQRIAHEQVYGRYNDYPPNWREVTPAELVVKSLRRLYAPVLMEYRQMGTLQLGAPPMLGATLWFFHDGSGYAEHFDFWEQRIRYFMFAACAHDMVDTSRPMHHASGMHMLRCTKCQYTTSYDTSD